MPTTHEVIVVGASAGGVEALQRLVRGLPEDLPAAMLIVMHVAARSKSYLPEILTRAGKLAAEHARDGEPILPGRIYVAPPDHHLVVEEGHIQLTCGPKEQHHRPCINVTFRSAAAAYGKRVVGVVLSGELDDGTAGLWEIERRGGTTVVQNPEEAPFPSMPLSALREVEVDHVASLVEMGPLLNSLVRGPELEHVQATQTSEGDRMDPQLTDLTCPECRGTLWEIIRGDIKDYRCRVGHTFSVRTMLSGHIATEERTLYAAIVALEEGASLTERLAGQFEPEMAEQLRTEARQRKTEADTIRNLLRNRVVTEIG